MIYSSTLTLAVQSALLLAMAGVVTWGLRRHAAALRHYVWTLALVLALVLPLWPERSFRLAVPVPASGVTRIVVTPEDGPMQSNVDVASMLVSVWMAGVILLLARIAVSHLRGAVLSRKAKTWGQDAWLVPGIAVPIVIGLSRPKILLPLDAADWDAERLQAVLAHERMHVLRRDLVWQLLAQITCAVYWPNPLVWLAARFQHKECEQSCDDGVLLSGVRATDYANHLVSIARNLQSNPQFEGGLSMATTSTLERRLNALLNPLTSHKPLSRGMLVTTAALSMILLAPIAGWKLVAQGSDGTQGVVLDAKGAPVAGAKVMIDFPLKSTDGSRARREATRTNAKGEFRFPAIPEDLYAVHIEMPGFAPLDQTETQIGGASAAPLRFTLNAGGRTTPPPPPPPPPPPGFMQSSSSSKQLRIGGNEQSAKLTTKVTPEYPADCKTERVQGIVMLRAVIDKAGYVADLRPINEFVDPRLLEAAVTAVKQWRYSTTVLNGEPVEVVTQIDVNFTLTQ